MTEYKVDAIAWFVLSRRISENFPGLSFNFKNDFDEGDRGWYWEYSRTGENTTSDLYEKFPDAMVNFIRWQQFEISIAATRISEQVPGFCIWREIDNGWRWMTYDDDENTPPKISDYFDSFPNALANFVKWKAEAEV